MTAVNGLLPQWARVPAVYFPLEVREAITVMYNSKVCKVSRVRRPQHNYRQLTRAILSRD